MSHIRRHSVLFLLAATCSLAVGAQTTIRFGNGPGTITGDPSNPSNFTTVYQESGFTLTTRTVRDSFVPPNPQAAWVFGDAAHHYDVDHGTFSVAASDGSLFRLLRLDVADSTPEWGDACTAGLYPPGTTIPSVDVTGLLGGSKVFSFNARGACPPVFTTNANPFSDLAVDELLFGTTPLASVDADNIVLTSVPEPSSYVLFAAGLSTLGLWARRRGQTAECRPRRSAT